MGTFPPFQRARPKSANRQKRPGTRRQNSKFCARTSTTLHRDTRLWPSKHHQQRHFCIEKIDTLLSHGPLNDLKKILLGVSPGFLPLSPPLAAMATRKVRIKKLAPKTPLSVLREDQIDPSEYEQLTSEAQIATGVEQAEENVCQKLTLIDGHVSRAPARARTISSCSYTTRLTQQHLIAFDTDLEMTGVPSSGSPAACRCRCRQGNPRPTTTGEHTQL